MTNPDLQPYLDKLQAFRAGFGDATGHGYGRLLLESFALSNRQPLPDGVFVGELLIPYKSGSLRVVTFRPDLAGPVPAVLYLHGGAFMEGSPETHFDITAKIAARVGAAVFSLDYSRAPEHPFPAAVNECAAALDWLFDEADTLGVDVNRIAVWGDSAGANLSAVTVQNRVDKAPGVAAQVLQYPVLDFDRSRPSYAENANCPIVPLASMDYIDALYCPNPVSRSNPDAAPLLADDFSKLPPSYIAVAEHDPLRDDGVEYFQKLQEAGVSTKFDPGEGLIHGYLRAVPFSESAAAAFDKSLDWLGTLYTGKT